jgi:hypothetical protein
MQSWWYYLPGTSLCKRRLNEFIKGLFSQKFDTGMLLLVPLDRLKIFYTFFNLSIFKNIIMSNFRNCYRYGT